MTASNLDKIDTTFVAAWLEDEATRIERATRQARIRAELIAAWLQIVIETDDSEATAELRGR